MISVILCHHTGNFVYKCVESIKRSKRVDYEIIIVTSDRNLDVPDCVIIPSYDGPAYKRNLGACMATGGYLAFFDDDTELDPECLFQMLVSMKPHIIGMVYSKLITMGTNKFDDAGSYLGNWGFLIERSGNVEDIGQFDEEVPILSGKSASCMIKKNLFERLGGFDKDFFMFGEETDLSWRIWLSGYKVLFTPMAVTHHAFNTPLKNVNQFYSQHTVHYHGCKNYITMLIKNLQWHNLIWILPRHLLVWLMVAIIFGLKGELTKSKYTFQGLFYNLWHLPTILKKKSHLNAHIRVQKDRAIWKYVFSHTPFKYYVNRFMTYVKQGRSGK